MNDIIKDTICMDFIVNSSHHIRRSNIITNNDIIAIKTHGISKGKILSRNQATILLFF